MNNNEKIEEIVEKILIIEKEAIQKRFNSSDGSSESFSNAKADTEAVNNILNILGEGKKGAKK